MLTKRLGILGAIAILPALAQVSSAPQPSDTAERMVPRRHRPIKDLSEHGDGTSTSSNWSGYAVTGSSFTNAKGSWIVPKAKCSSGDQYASFWVGIDGYSSGTVEQTGTDSDCSGGSPVYYAWYEFYPAFPVNLGMTIKPGDHMSAKVVYSSSKFTITMTNETTGKTFSKTASVSGAKRSSAEWIAEAPSSSSGVLPLANFTEVLFGDDHTSVSGTCNAKDSSTNGPIGSFPASAIQEITMEKNSVKEAIPAKLSSDGTSFSVTWHAK
jgi:hypothetical protein